MEPIFLRGVDVVVFAICGLTLRKAHAEVAQFYAENADVFAGWEGRLVIADARRLFSRWALSTVVDTARVLADIVRSKHGPLWEEWAPGVPAERDVIAVLPR